MQLLAVRGKRQKRRFAFFCCLWSDREFVSIPRTSAREPAFSICHPERAKRVEGSLKIKKSLSFRPREGAAATDRVEKSCAVRIERQAPFLYSRLLLGGKLSQSDERGKNGNGKSRQQKNLLTAFETKSKQKGPALKGAFCAPCGSSSLQYLGIAASSIAPIHRKMRSFRVRSNRKRVDCHRCKAKPAGNTTTYWQGL